MSNDFVSKKDPNQIADVQADPDEWLAVLTFDHGVLDSNPASSRSTGF